MTGGSLLIENSTAGESDLAVKISSTFQATMPPQFSKTTS
jgi:hypothetical protein